MTTEQEVIFAVRNARFSDAESEKTAEDLETWALENCPARVFEAGWSTLEDLKMNAVRHHIFCVLETMANTRRKEGGPLPPTIDEIKAALHEFWLNYGSGEPGK